MLNSNEIVDGAGLRVKAIRKEKGMSQEAFAKKLGISRSNLGNIETGAVNLTDRVIKDICSEFSVNELFLRTGQGDMFKQLTILEQAYVRFGSIMEGPDEEKKVFVSTILEIVEHTPAELWSYIIGTYRNCKESSKKEKDS